MFNKLPLAKTREERLALLPMNLDRSLLPPEALWHNHKSQES
ncbi:MAG: hypothetical protein OZSIB_3732 [Candidatus Ozemobacter sibiricus]|uniref:Uncharacterized protein n=1 Tax=Candidatus Ozemobacter sibiricus TaxID=2268124 RepID=A0A367ZDF0_9BACT|nr:MAG: hypothetical protein OZSIB_3732 [Candidatus Ozemobacter sibiricus]